MNSGLLLGSVNWSDSGTGWICVKMSRCVYDASA